MTNPNWPAIVAEVAFNAAPNDSTATPSWTDLSTRLIDSFKTKRGRQYELGRIEAGESGVTFRNDDGALDPNNAASIYAPNVLPYRQLRLSATWAAVTYRFYTGLVERWPQSWDSPAMYGRVNTTVIDVLGPIARSNLLDCLSSEVLLDGPTAYYPLNEADTAATGGSLAASTAPRALPRISKNGNPSWTFGQPELLADLGTSFEVLTGGTTGPFTGSALSLVSPKDIGGQCLSGRGALEVWWRTTATTSNICELISQHNPDGSNVRLGVGYGPLNTIFLDTVDDNSGGSGGPAKKADGTTNVIANDNGVHHAVLSLAADGKTVSWWIDGVKQTDHVMASAVNWIGDAITVAGCWDYTRQQIVRPCQGNGFFSAAAIYQQPLTDARVKQHYLAGTTLFVGETSDLRVKRLLSYGGYTGTVSAETGQSTMSAATALNDVGLVDALQQVLDTELGDLFVAGNGTLTFQSRYHRYRQTTAKWVLGENTAAGEVPYKGDVEPDFDPTFVINQVLRSRPGGVTVMVEDATSVLNYFPAVDPTSTIIYADTDQAVIDAATFALQRYKDPHPRVAAVTIDPASYPAAWPMALGAEIGDRVTFTRRPITAPAFSFDCFIESIAHDVDPERESGAWLTTFELSPAFPFTYWLLGAAKTTVHTAMLAASTTMTIDPLSDSARNPIEADIAPGALLQLVKASTPTTNDLVAVITVTSSTPHKAGYATGTLTFVRVLTAAGLPTALTTTAAVALSRTGSTVVTLSGNTSGSATHLWIDGELCPITAGAGTASVTITRNSINSQATHASGATVYQGVSGGAVNAYSVNDIVQESVLTNLAANTIYDGRWDAFSTVGSFATTVGAAVTAGDLALFVNALPDWPTNIPQADMTAVVCVLDPASANRENVTIYGATTTAITDVNGAFHVQLGGIVDVLAAAAQANVIVAGRVDGWTAGQQVKLTALPTATTETRTISTVTDNLDGTVTLGLSAVLTNSYPIGSTAQQLVKNAHSSGVALIGAQTPAVPPALTFTGTRVAY